ncbi:peptidoglycan-associated lipoprotein Pal [Novosphingobium sp. TH158]|uniref:peptidoglycan-associated lipoprotein Pal n=1 Tax=Novosphingobium sp. TH158 TaxID=2067455 RepID=UPI00156F35C0|nr:peptidoglycan-associated lipoprotein Pal [Novosphingobium sp. TH158]
MSQSKTLILLLAGSAALAGCSPKPPKQLPPDPGNVATTTQTTPGTMGQPAPGSQADFVARMMGRDTIYFDTDKFNIDSQDAVALQGQAQWLMQYPAKRATIEGHADERGTRDYNLALGEKRANAAKNYLVSLGVEASRLTTISYGKERPVATGSNEEAWAKNRRAVTLTID